jgi:tetratricopeptide (TPR) repeat protein
VRGKVLDGAGLIAWLLGKHEQATSRHQEALALWREAGNEREVARSLYNLGWVASSLGELDVAVPRFEEALAHFRQIGDERSTAGALQALSDAALNKGDYDRARTLAEESLAIFRRIGEPGGMALLTQFLGRLAWHGGQYIEASVYYEESLARWRLLSHSEGIALDLVNLGRVRQRLGDLSDAERLFEEGRSLAHDIGDKGTEAFALYGLGHLELEREAFPKARLLLGQCLRLNEEIAERLGISECVESMAGVALGLGAADIAVMLLAVAETMRMAIGIPLADIMRADHERFLQHAQAQLDRATFDDLWAMGSIMSPQQAVTELERLPV